MRIVVGAVVERPLAHSGSHAVGDFERQRRPPLHRIEQLGINRLVEIPAHGLAAEYLRTEILGRTSLGSLHFDGFVIDGRLHHLNRSNDMGSLRIMNSEYRKTRTLPPG